MPLPLTKRELGTFLGFIGIVDFGLNPILLKPKHYIPNC
jgi:hypothetical protein